MPAQISTKVFIDGNQYALDDLKFHAKIPEEYFSKQDGLSELGEWLHENTEDVWWICFHNFTVCFRSESDATHMKLVLG